MWSVMANQVEKIIYRRSFIFECGQKRYRYTEAYEEIVEAEEIVIIDLTDDDINETSIAPSTGAKGNEKLESSSDQQTSDTVNTIANAVFHTQSMANEATIYSPTYQPNSPIFYNEIGNSPSPPYRPTTPEYLTTLYAPASPFPPGEC